MIRTTSGSELLRKSLLPLNQQQLETIPGEEAARMLRAGQALVNKRVVGDLIVGREGLGSPFEFELDDGRKTVLAGLEARPPLSRAAVESAIRVESCRFEGVVQLAGLAFKHPVELEGVEFCADAVFDDSTFEDTVTCSQCRFGGKAGFSDATFYKPVHLDRSVFVGPLDFFNTACLEGAGMSNAVFESSCNLTHSRFVQSELILPCLAFRGSVCQGPAFMEGIKLEGVADFTEAQFRRSAAFGNTDFRYVNFTHAEFQRLDLKWEQISGHKLLFGNLVVEDFDAGKGAITREEWARLFDQRPAAPLSDQHRQYDVLKAIFVRQGDHVSADGCFYEWKQVERRQSPLGWSPENWIIKAFHWFNWLSCGYGVKPIRAVFFALVVIVLFAAGYTALEPSMPAASLMAALARNLGYSFLAFTNFAATEGVQRPIAEMLFLAERVIGWLTLLLFVTTYTRIMLR